jgi:RNA polymerase sigma-70 factor (family 1)
LSYHTYTDVELVELLKGGDVDSYTEIYNRYKGVLYRHAFKRLKNQHEADDILQDIFTNLWIKRSTFDPQNNLGGYLYVSLRNKILNIIAHKAIHQTYEGKFQQIVDEGTAITDHRVRLSLLKEMIESEVSSLPSKMKEIFEYSRNDHLSHRQIAEKLNISEKTVRNQINNALKILRNKLGIGLYVLVLLKIL